MQYDNLGRTFVETGNGRGHFGHVWWIRRSAKYSLSFAERMCLCRNEPTPRCSSVYDEIKELHSLRKIDHSNYYLYFFISILVTLNLFF